MPSIHNLDLDLLRTTRPFPEVEKFLGVGSESRLGVGVRYGWGGMPGSRGCFHSAVQFHAAKAETPDNGHSCWPIKNYSVVGHGCFAGTPVGPGHGQHDTSTRGSRRPPLPLCARSYPIHLVETFSTACFLQEYYNLVVLSLRDCISTASS